MKISTKGRYALRMLTDLAQNSKDGYIALNDVSKRQDISKKYLEQIVPPLTHAGLIGSLRGFNGGYKLLKQPSEITVGDVLRATEGDLEPVACLAGNTNECPRRDFCPMLPVWHGLSDVIANYLDGITLADVLAGCGEAGGSYSI